MDDFKSVTMSYLRDLARKHLGTGYSKLTKTELIAALAQFVPALKKVARIAGIDLPTPSKPVAKAAAPASKQPRAPQGKESRAGDKDKKKEPEKKAAERKKAPEPKEPEKKAAERKKAPELKAPAPKEPEKKVAERRKEPEPK